MAKPGRPCPVSNAQEIEIVNLYKAGVSRNKLAILFNASRPFIVDCLDRHGVIRRNLKEACPGLPLRHDAFASAHRNDEASYWVGFIMADGCISIPKTVPTPHLIVVLAKKDESHVEALRSFLGSSNLIQQIPARASNKGSSGAASRLDLVSSQLTADLAIYGVVPRKTRIATVSHHLVSNRHFWRGYVDGNGGMRFEPKDRITRGAFRFYVDSGSEAIIKQFVAYARPLIGEPKIYFSGGAYCIRLHGEKAFAIANQLYQNGDFALERKRAKINQIR